MLSARLAFCARGPRAAAPGIEHDIDELEHRAPIGGWEFFDALEPLETARGLGCERVAYGGDAHARLMKEFDPSREQRTRIHEEIAKQKKGRDLDYDDLRQIFTDIVRKPK